MVTARRVLLGALVLVCLSASVNPVGAHRRARQAGTASVAQLPWAPVAGASIRPGAQTVTGGGQCTANFVFADAGGAVYLGQAAHCAATGAAIETDGCDSASLPLGTHVEILGASRPGTLVYSSWRTMQELGETDPATCRYNDFALVRLDPADVARVNPSVPFWGGPTGLAGGTRPGDLVYSYGSSGLRLGLSVLSPKRGVSVGDEGGGWSHAVFTVTPGVPGDSGSAFLDAGGRALGVLSTLQVLPLVGSNGVGNLGRELAYLRARTGLTSVEVVPGTEPFDGNRLL